MREGDLRRFTAAFPALAGALPTAAVRQLLFAARRVRFESGTPLVRGGEPTGDLFLVLDGVVRVGAGLGGTELWTVGAGGAIGASGFVDPGVCELTATTASPCTVLWLRHEQLIALAATEPRLARELLDYLAAELLASRDRLKSLFSTLRMEKLA